MTLALELLALAGLILLNAFFVAAEYGLVTSRRTRILELEHAGQPPRARRAADHGRPAAVHRGDAARRHDHLAWPSAPSASRCFAHLFEPVMAAFLAVILALLIITYLHVVIGELVPKGIALGYPERTALAVSAPVRGVLHRLQAADLAAPALDRVDPARARPRAARRRARGALRGRAAHAALELGRAGRDRARRAGDALQGLRLRRQGGRRRDGAAAGGGRALDRPAGRGGAAGRARVAVHALPGLPRARSTRSSASSTSATWSRRCTSAGSPRSTSRSILRPATMVPETKDLAALLTEFRRTNQHMAIVIDEYGNMEGIVTLEDLLEEIVGEIEDEFDLPGRDGRAGRRGHDPDRRHVHDRRLQRAVRRRAPGRGLPHGRRLRLRRARPPGRAGRRGRARRHALPRRRGRGPADRPADRHVRRRRHDGEPAEAERRRGRADDAGLRCRG